ncbi:MAG: glycerophosphoryl diester phosphodiesterase membrane domain-containing protein [Bacteroidales bacterium]|nr:glycerophosphoryl diester phosphodiesterase membrane domain-containing protein [Bacteroidales bacterium]
MEILNNNSDNLVPSAGDVYGISWNIMWKSFVGLLAVTIIYCVISGPTAMVQWKADDFSLFLIPLVLFGIGFGIFVAGPIGYSTKWVFLKAVRGESYEIQDMFAVFNRNYWNAVAANVVVGVIVGIGILMLIFPGIIFACRLAFVPYLVIDREMELTEAMNKSWQMTRGYGWQIFLMGILAFFIVILGLIVLFFGVIISVMWINTAFATIYQAVVEKERYFQNTME